MINITSTVTYQPSGQTQQIAQLLLYMLHNTYTETELHQDLLNRTVNQTKLEQNQTTIQQTIETLLQAIQTDLGPEIQLVQQADKLYQNTNKKDYDTQYLGQNRQDVRNVATTLLNQESKHYHNTNSLTTLINQLTLAAVLLKPEKTKNQTTEISATEISLKQIEDYEKQTQNTPEPHPYTEYQHKLHYTPAKKQPYTEYGN